MRVVKIAAGFGLLGCGIAMLALPGPGWLAIAGALAILATEFEWARRAHTRIKAVLRIPHGSKTEQPNDERDRRSPPPA